MKSLEARVDASRIDGLDLLRLVCALAVTAFHFFYAGPLMNYMPPGMLNAPSQFGHFGVDVFFMISGFVISFCSVKDSVTEFLWRRFLRLMPAMLICSIISALLLIHGHTMPVSQVLLSWAASLTFFPKLFGIDYLSGVYWTLSIEVTFYLLVGAMIVSGFWRKSQLVIVAVWLTLAFGNAYGYYTVWADKILVLTYAGHFSVGIILYNVRFRGAHKLWLLALLPSMALVTRYAFMVRADQIVSLHTDVPVWAIYVIPWGLLGLLVASIYLPKTRLPRLMVALAGKTSYPLYLLHASLGTTIAMFSARHVNLGLAALVAVIGILAISAGVAVYLEDPLRRVMRRATILPAPATLTDPRSAAR
jgi:peptidoglycan/LPS O-acetylase OafA/YrhL